MKFPCKSGEVSGEGAGRVWDVSGAGFWGGSVVASGSTARQRRGPGMGFTRDRARPRAEDPGSLGGGSGEDPGRLGGGRLGAYVLNYD